MTWGELKLLTLQKLFAVTGDEMVSDDTTKTYLSAMPGAANEALQLLAASGLCAKKAIRLSLDGAAAQTQRFDLSVLCPDFYALDDQQVFHISEDGTVTRTANYRVESDHALLIGAKIGGELLLYYNAYPQTMARDTPDETRLALKPEAAALLPLYMASQLYKEDDAGIAVQYRNEFEAARETLMGNAARTLYGHERFTSQSGWW